MAVVEKKKLVNGRVGESSVTLASKVLKQRGLTMSEYVRNSVDYVARTGTIPESGFAVLKTAEKSESARAFLRKFENLPMPGKADFAGMNDDEIVSAIRSERYGY